jgi:hypothetical protein
MPDLAEFDAVDQHREEGREPREQSSDCLFESEVRRELDVAFNALGGVAFALLHHRVLTDKRLEGAAQRVYELYAQLDRLSPAARVGLQG